MKPYFKYKGYWLTLITLKWLIIIGCAEYQYIWYKRRLQLIKEDPKGFFNY